MQRHPFDSIRFDRQVRFAGFGQQGQAALARSRILIVGLGGLGSWLAELLARAGVGMLRIVDPDQVEMINLHRQGLYDQQDADGGVLKVIAAQRRLRSIAPDTSIEPIAKRLEPSNVNELAHDVELILDGTDNFATRFLLNDYAVRHGISWIFAGVVEAQGQVMPILPGQSACLRCVYEIPPPEYIQPTAATAGVLGPAVAAVASIEAVQAVRILSGALTPGSAEMIKLNLWTGAIQRLNVSNRRADCPCCIKGRFDFLDRR